jgi:hypothetical protein
LLPSADGDGAVLGRVVLIDVQVADDLAGNVDQRMARELFDHVIEEADSGRHLIRARTVEINLDRNVGFLGFAVDPRGALCGHKAGPIITEASESMLRCTRSP